VVRWQFAIAAAVLLGAPIAAQEAQPPAEGKPGVTRPAEGKDGVTRPAPGHHPEPGPKGGAAAPS
jgi:hypothetical protein